MKREDLSALVLNSIRDAKTITENYDYFRQQENEGLWKDFMNAEAYISSFASYYESRDTRAVEEIKGYVSQYYSPFVEVFSEPENRHMRAARRIGSVAWKGAAAGAVLAAVCSGFLAPTITMLIAALSSYGCIRSIKESRKRCLNEFKKLHDEAKTIGQMELEAVLNEDELMIREKLSGCYLFDKA